jgi:hypothetical protein
MFLPVAGRPVLPRLDRAAQRAADEVSVPAQDCVRGDQQPHPVAACFRYHAEQGREQGPVRPVQVRATRLPLLQDCELVAQDQDLRGFPCLLTPGDPGGSIRPHQDASKWTHLTMTGRPEMVALRAASTRNSRSKPSQDQTSSESDWLEWGRIKPSWWGLLEPS